MSTAAARAADAEEPASRSVHAKETAWWEAETSVGGTMEGMSRSMASAGPTTAKSGSETEAHSAAAQAASVTASRCLVDVAHLSTARTLYTKSNPRRQEFPLLSCRCIQ